MKTRLSIALGFLLDFIIQVCIGLHLLFGSIVKWFKSNIGSLLYSAFCSLVIVAFFYLKASGYL